MVTHKWHDVLNTLCLGAEANLGGLVLIIALIWVFVGYKAAIAKRKHWNIIGISAFCVSAVHIDISATLRRNQLTAGEQLIVTPWDFWSNAIQYTLIFSILWAGALMMGVWGRSRIDPQ
ncbi:hypothetical protein [Novosphingobium humi]|uniref:hypothetical protein n=1 Tax=Novosphingobium humi TaxID=2282397 RepID=UPI0025B01273|nr:hypothetical protein [Novosphingobium humi]WJS99386.1 hypothetical protein NYQ05_04330 [Novosphingobium humi]